MSRFTFLVLLAVTASRLSTRADPPLATDEPAIVPSREVQDLPVVGQLPDPFAFLAGGRVESPDEWFNKRREQIKAMLLDYEYGHLPPAPGNVTAVRVSSTVVGNENVRREQIILTCGPRDALTFTLDLLIPQGKPGLFPVILTGDPGVTPILTLA